MQTTTTRRASPLRVLQRLTWRLRSSAPSLAVEVMGEQLATQERELTAAATDARTIEAGLDGTRRAMSAALNDPHTPGVITTCEARAIAGVMIDTSALATNHATRLEAMV